MGVKEGVPDSMNRFARKYPGYRGFFPMSCFGATGPMSRAPENAFRAGHKA